MTEQERKVPAWQSMPVPEHRTRGYARDQWEERFERVAAARRAERSSRPGKS